jgi:hypothetical protein
MFSIIIAASMLLVGGNAFAQTTSPVATSSQKLAPGGGTVTLPAFGEYGGTLTYASGARVDTSITLTMSTTLPPGTPKVLPGNVVGKPLVYLTVVFSQNVTFLGAVGITSMTVPSSTPVAGHTFAYAAYDLSGPTYVSTTNGTIAPDGLIHFAMPAFDVETVAGGKTYLIVLSTV